MAEFKTPFQEKALPKEGLFALGIQGFELEPGVADQQTGEHLWEDFSVLILQLPVTDFKPPLKEAPSPRKAFCPGHPGIFELAAGVADQQTGEHFWEVFSVLVLSCCVRTQVRFLRSPSQGSAFAMGHPGI